jgi:2-oxo-3-hexenedioate decarboxylase
MTQIDLDELARGLDEAAANASAVPQLSATYSLTIAQACEIQRLSVARRIRRGERMAGVKMGFTSRAKMRQMGVEEMIWGRLTDAMMVEDGGRALPQRYIHPRAEPEIAFLMKRPLSGPVTPAQAMAAVEAVAPAIEIIDSRYRDFRFTLPDVIADNCSSAGFAVGPWNDPRIDVGNLGMVFQINGRPAGIGSSAAVLGHPARALVAASRLLGENGLALEAGWIVMVGSPVEATALEPGAHVLNEVEALGRVEFTVSAT